MGLTWRKRINVTHELTTDIPLDPVSLQNISKVKVTMCVWGDYEVVSDKDDKHRTHVKLLDHFSRFIVEQLKPHNDETYKRWIFDVHNFAYSSLSKFSIEQTCQKSEPYKIERNGQSTSEQPSSEMNHFNKFWRRLWEEKDFIDSHFDVYRFKGWLQFDLNLPKCLTGISRSNKNYNKEFQIYSRSHGFLLDVLMKWCDIVIDKVVYIKLYDTKPTPQSNSKHSFVFVMVQSPGPSCASMSIYIAMHRDIPFIEQQEIRQELVDKLTGVQFQGSLLLDSSIKVGLDTTLKKRGGSFIPFNLKAEHACQQIPKNIDDVLANSAGQKRNDMYLHKLVCAWKTCPNVNCCSDDLIKDLRNEIFNALFRVRLQEQFRPLIVNGKTFSCFQMLRMSSETGMVTSPDSKEGGTVTCLVQYVITVDDDIAAEKKDQRKISSDFTTEIYVEPQWGRVNCKTGNLSYLDNLEFPSIPPHIFDLDFKLISSLCTFATIKKLCSQQDKHQPGFSNQFCPKPTNFREPVSKPDLPYLFLVSNLLTRSHLTVLEVPLLTAVLKAEGTTECSPNTYLLRCLCDLLEVSFSRNISLSGDELRNIKKDVKDRFPVGEKIQFADEIPVENWKCFVRFHKIDKKDDKYRIQFVLVPVPPESLSESKIIKWFPNGTVDIFVFDCFYRILLGTFTNPQRCSLEKLYACDRLLEGTDKSDDLRCPLLISQIIEESMITTQSPQSLEKKLNFSHISEISRLYQKSYILGLHYAMVTDTLLEEQCVARALEFIESPRLQDVHVKKERKLISLAKYLGAVCSHVSGQPTCCHSPSDQEALNRSIDSSDRGDVTSEAYSADVEVTEDSKLIEDEADETSANYATAENSMGDSDEEDLLSTPCENETQWPKVSGGLSVQKDVFYGEITASSAELTPVIDDKRFADSVRSYQNYNEDNAEIDNDSGGSSVGEHPSLSDEGNKDTGGSGFKEIEDMGTRKELEMVSSLETIQEPENSVSLVSETDLLDLPSLHIANKDEQQNQGKRVSFFATDARTMSTTSSENAYCPTINIISSTPSIPVEDNILVATEEHKSIKDKFDAIIDNRFIRMSQYTDNFLIMRSDRNEHKDSLSVDTHSSVLFMKMWCKHAFSEGHHSTPIRTLPTCVREVVEGTEKRKRDVELFFTYYTLPPVVVPSPTYRSPTHSFIASRQNPHRRKDSYKKGLSDTKSGEKKIRTTSEQSYSTHQVTISNNDESDDGIQEFKFNRITRNRDQLPVSSSSPSLSTRHIPSSLNPRHVLDDMFEEVTWLIENQYITHLRRKTPVTLDTLKQVMDHCRRAPSRARNCCLSSETLHYVDTWVPVVEDMVRQDQKHERLRHDELLAKIELANEEEPFRLCKIENYFYYSLSEENEQRDLGGREILSAQSSISSIGSRPSHYRSSSSSFAEEIIPASECTMKPCSKWWIVIYVTYNKFEVAFQTADTGTDHQIETVLIDKLVSQIAHLNKVQNQENLLHQIVEFKSCPKELLFNHTLLPNNEGYNNRYVCNVVHRIEVQLWDKTEIAGLTDIKESLFNFKCDNVEEDVYYHIQDAAKNDRSTYYFQLPKESGRVKSKKLYIDVRGLQPPDPDKQSTFDLFVQQKLEEAKLEDIAHRLNRNCQAKLTEEEVSFLSNRNCKSLKPMYITIPEYVHEFLPHFWFYLDQHLVQQQKLFCPRYGSHQKRMEFFNENNGELEKTQDHEIFMKIKIENRRGQQLFQSLHLVNITIVDPDNQRVNFNKKWFRRKSPAFEQVGYSPPDASENEDIKLSNKLDENSKLSLKLRIIEKRKKAGSAQKSDGAGFESSFQAVQAAFTSLLLEVYILPVELTERNASSIVSCLEDPELPSTPKPSSSVGKTGGLLGMMKGRRNSQDNLDTLKDLEVKERLRRKMPTSSSKDENSSLHRCLQEPCIEACRVGAQSKSRIVEHHFLRIPSIFVSNQVINKIINELSKNFKFKVRIFGQESEYKMIPPTCHTEDEIENSGIVLVARRLSLWNDSRMKLNGSDMMGTDRDEKPNIEQILALETGTIDVSKEKLEVPRQMHILIILNSKKLNMYFYNVHEQVLLPFITSIKYLVVSWLNTRKMVLNRILLLKARHELPPHYTQSALLPETGEEVDRFVEETEPPSDQLPSDQEKQQSNYKNTNIENYYVHLYDHYHPGTVKVSRDTMVSRDPIKRHGSQLGAYMRAFEQKKEEEENKVDLDDPDLPNKITREQAKLLKKNARLIHYIASPLLFSSKLKSSQTDKETFSYVSNTTNDLSLEEPAWFLHFKNQLFDNFILYLKDPARGINMTLKYEPRGINKDVEPRNTLNNDDNEALLCKETVGGGRILLGVLIQNSTFCVKLYGFDSDNRLKVFQECSNLKTHTHTNSFNYDWMVRAILDSLTAHRDSIKIKQTLPIHHCVQSVVKHYETVAEPPHTQCWIKQFSDLVYVSQAKQMEYNINPDSLHDYIVQNQDTLGYVGSLFTIPAHDTKGKKGDEGRLLVLVPGDFQVNFKMAIIVSELSYISTWEFGLSYYIVLVKEFNSTPPATLLKEPSYIRTKNESLTISLASSPGSDEGLELMDSRTRLSSQIFGAHNAKQELYGRAKMVAELELRELLQCAQKSYHRDALIQKLLRPPPGRITISLEQSYHSFLKDDFTYYHLCELEGELSFNKNLLEERSAIYRLLQDWNHSRFKKLLEFLKSKVDVLIIRDPNAESDKGEIGILTKRTAMPGKSDKISIVVVKRTKYFNLDVFAILKSQEECRDSDHIAFWERILSLICVYVWERLFL